MHTPVVYKGSLPLAGAQGCGAETGAGAPVLDAESAASRIGKLGIIQRDGVIHASGPR